MQVPDYLREDVMVNIYRGTGRVFTFPNCKRFMVVGEGNLVIDKMFPILDDAPADLTNLSGRFLGDPISSTAYFKDWLRYGCEIVTYGRFRFARRIIFDKFNTNSYYRVWDLNFPETWIMRGHNRWSDTLKFGEDVIEWEKSDRCIKTDFGSLTATLIFNGASLQLLEAIDKCGVLGSIHPTYHHGVDKIQPERYEEYKRIMAL